MDTRNTPVHIIESAGRAEGAACPPGTQKLLMKKKWIAVTAALALSASLIPGAMAAEMKEYTLEEADTLTDLYGYDGYKADIPGTDFTMWYRDTMIDVEITEEGQKQGYLLASIGPTCMLSVKLLDENISLEEYTKQVQEGISPSAEIQKVNDVDFAIYDEPENDGVLCRVAATALPEGKILEFVYVYKEDSVLPEINCSIASIHLKTTQNRNTSF